MDMDPNDAAKIKADNEKYKAYQDKLASQFGSTFRSEAGKAVLQHLSVICNAHGSTVKDKIHPDPNSVLFEEGKRMIYEYILIYLRADAERRKGTK